LREKHPFKKSTPNYDAASGIIAGELFIEKKRLLMDDDFDVVDVAFAFFRK
jgi:hypothetical protein